MERGKKERKKRKEKKHSPTIPLPSMFGSSYSSNHYNPTIEVVFKKKLYTENRLAMTQQYQQSQNYISYITMIIITTNLK